MVDTMLLSKKIGESGLKQEYISNQLGITPASFRNKMKNRTRFNSTEIAGLIRILGINTVEVYSIFFTELVDKTATNTN